MANIYPIMKERYSGQIRLITEELDVKYGSGKSIFIEHCNDLFAKDVPSQMIITILQHCRQYPKNTYIFQTKNPERYHEELLRPYWPEKRILGTTIETNRDMRLSGITKAPGPHGRALAIRDIKCATNFDTFITIEPILDFDMTEFFHLLCMANPTFINIGADSKGSDLPEPSKKKIEELLMRLSYTDIEIRRKVNLERLLQ